ncbi:Transposase [Phytophthora megakarya]|uniref:Transposase n=1 Tax=Phytophthora megakarya TaxID=4795 RepID=A0A225WZ05_9STRA|nr:Transposase [Phytophthora megakarya]
MVWGAFVTKGKSELVVLEGRQNPGHYIYTVSEHLLPFAHKHYGTDFVFMQDNASIHSSNETRMFFQEIGVQLLDWSARSPDLNPIENVWAILSRKVYGHAYCCRHESLELSHHEQAARSFGHHAGSLLRSCAKNGDKTY